MREHNGQPATDHWRASNRPHILRSVSPYERWQTRYICMFRDTSQATGDRPARYFFGHGHSPSQAYNECMYIRWRQTTPWWKRLLGMGELTYNGPSTQGGPNGPGDPAS